MIFVNFMRCPPRHSCSFLFFVHGMIQIEDHAYKLIYDVSLEFICRDKNYADSLTLEMPIPRRSEIVLKITDFNQVGVAIILAGELNILIVEYFIETLMPSFFCG